MASGYSVTNSQVKADILMRCAHRPATESVCGAAGELDCQRVGSWTERSAVQVASGSDTGTTAQNEVSLLAVL